MNLIILPNETNARYLYPLITLLGKFNIIAYSSWGIRVEDALYKTYLKLPLLSDKLEYAKANCLAITYTTRGDRAANHTV